MTSPGKVDKRGLNVGKGAAYAAEDSAEGVLLDLIARCEAEVGPDRELDLECWWWCKASQPGVPMEPEYKAHNLQMNDAPRYTASLDAALTLVPEGHGYFVEDLRTGADLVWATVAEIKRTSAPLIGITSKSQIHGLNLIGFGHAGRARTAPLALVTAALKARLSALPAHKRRPTSPQETAE